jgi:hypothetical protein
MTLRRSACVAIPLALGAFLADPVLAAGCASQAEVAALKTAVMQQELMVAALQCHEAGAYNRFVSSWRGELQSSDATLKAFFVRRGGEHGEAGYDTFKTKAANLSGLEQARDAHAFCADAHALFAAAKRHHGTLASFVESRASGPLGGICAESRPAPVMTAAKPPPLPAPVPVRVADAKPVPGPAAIAVPEHSLPAAPWRREEPAAAPMRAAQQPTDDDALDDADQDAAPAYANDEEILPPPPPRPRAYQIRDRDYGPRPRWYDRSYGPPADWRENWRDDWRSYPPPRARWYPRDYYGDGW